MPWNRRVLVGMMGWVCVAVFGAAAPPPSPEVRGANGEKAFQDLAALYADGKEPDVDGALRRLSGDDAAARKGAGEYLAALFRQSFADENNGRAKWRPLPFFGGGSESPAREFRKAVATKFAAGSNYGPEAIDAALWLIDSDQLANDQTAGVAALRHVRGAEAIKAFKSLLSPAHHNGQVVTSVLEEVENRNLKELSPEVRELCANYRQHVRDAARRVAGKLGITAPEFNPANAFTPWVTDQLAQIRSMVMTEIPPTAKWRRFTVTYKPERKGEDPRTEEFSAFLLDETPERFHVLDLFGRDRTIEKNITRTADRTMRQDADEFLRIRAGKEDSGERRNSLSERGGLTGQFEPGFVSLPEILLAAWSFDRGDRATAAAVIFPRFDEAPDERFIVMVARDLIGRHYHEQMLYAFSYERNYAKTIDIARHLSKPVFNEYQYQDRARELASQLSHRQEDFKSLVLPSPQAWAQMSKTLARPQQIEYLASRLRLLNCFQWGQPGGVSYEDDQSATPSVDNNGGRSGTPGSVINPVVELKKMNLSPADLPTLVPYLADENFIPTYSYWRDFHPARTLHRVNWIVAQLVNSVAKTNLADMEAYSTLDAEAKKKQLKSIDEWVAHNAGRTTTELLLQTLTTTREFGQYRAAAAELAHMKSAAAIPVLGRRVDDFPQDRSDAIELCYRVKPAEFVQKAKSWIAEGDEGSRFWAAMILFDAGPATQDQGFNVLREILGRDESLRYLPEAMEPLIRSKRADAMAVACSVFSRKEAQLRDWTFDAMTHRLLIEGRQEALDFAIRQLSSTEPGGQSWGTYKYQNVQRQNVAGDAAAQAICRWRKDRHEFEILAPDEERAAERAKLKTWLADQFALIKAGKPSGISTDVGPIGQGQWQLDAP